MVMVIQESIRVQGNITIASKGYQKETSAGLVEASRASTRCHCTRRDQHLMQKHLSTESTVNNTYLANSVVRASEMVFSDMSTLSSTQN